MFQTRPRLCGLCLSAHSPETSRSRLMAQHVCVHVHVRSVCRPADRTVTTAATATTSTMLGRPGRSKDAAAAPATNRTRTRVNQRAHTCHALASTSPGGRHRAAAAAASEPTPPAAAAQQPTKHQLRSGVSAMHSQWPQHSRQHSSIINGMRVLRNVDTHTHTRTTSKSTTPTNPARCDAASDGDGDGVAFVCKSCRTSASSAACVMQIVNSVRRAQWFAVHCRLFKRRHTLAARPDASQSRWLPCALHCTGRRKASDACGRSVYDTALSLGTDAS